MGGVRKAFASGFAEGGNPSVPRACQENSYFEVTAHQRSDGLRADVNIYSIEACMGVVNLFESFPLLSCKQDEFNVWAKIVEDKENLQVRRGWRTQRSVAWPPLQNIFILPWILSLYNKS